MVNKVILVGNLGQDPELRSTAGGTSVVTLRLATTERRKDRDGNWSDHTEWHTVVAFGRTADNINQYCRKGKQLYVEGRLQTRKWEDKEGNTRYSTEIVADDVRFLGAKDGGGDRDSSRDSGGDRGGYSRPQQQQRRPTNDRPYQPPADDAPYPADEDIPF